MVRSVRPEPPRRISHSTSLHRSLRTSREISRRQTSADFASLMGAARNSVSAPRASTRIDGFLRTLAVPLRFGTTDWQQVELVALKHEPDRNRDGLPSLPANHAELDLTVSGKAFFKVLLGPILLRRSPA